MWKVWKTYPQHLWISARAAKKEKRTELSTLIVDNSVEKCAEVLLATARMAIPVPGQDATSHLVAYLGNVVATLAVARIIVLGLRLWLLN